MLNIILVSVIQFLKLLVHFITDENFIAGEYFRSNPRYFTHINN